MVPEREQPWVLFELSQRGVHLWIIATQVVPTQATRCRSILTYEYAYYKQWQHPKPHGHELIQCFYCRYDNSPCGAQNYHECWLNRSRVDATLKIETPFFPKPLSDCRYYRHPNLWYFVGRHYLASYFSVAFLVGGPHFSACGLGYNGWSTMWEKSMGLGNIRDYKCTSLPGRIKRFLWT